MNELDDFICSLQSDEFEEDYWHEEDWGELY